MTVRPICAIVFAKRYARFISALLKEEPLMKCFPRLLALALACALLLGLGMTAACADTCYEMIKYTFSVEDNGDFA